MSIPSLAVKILKKNIAHFPTVNDSQKMALGLLGSSGLLALAKALYTPDPLDSFPLPVNAPAKYGVPSNASLDQSSTALPVSPVALPSSDSKRIPVPDILPYSKPFIDKALLNGDAIGKALKDIDSDTLSRESAIDAQNLAQLEKAGSGVFLQNMALSKASIDEISFAINAQSAVFAMIYNTLETHLSILSGVALQSLVLDNTAPARTAEGTKIVSYPPIDYTKYYERIASHADSAKDVADYQRTVRSITDVYGNEIVNAKPMEVVAMKDVALAKGEADTNSLGSADLDFVSSLFDDMDLSSDMFKSYVRIDSILEQASKVASGDSENWSSLMDALYGGSQ